jgi:myo-inositol-1(or 4)-monophosphatase
MIEVAKEAAIRAGEISLELRAKKHRVTQKESASDFATEVDILSERKILEILKEAFPDHGFLMEESGEIDRGADFVWVIDPIDGTIPYFSGLPTYGISIGLLKNGEPILGVINLPALNQLYWANGDTAFLNGKRIHVNAILELQKAIVGFGVGYIGGREEEIRNLILPLADKVKYPPILDCNVAGMVYVASGEYGAFIHKAYPWDHAAGVAIIRGSGGMVTDFKGKELDWSKDMIEMVASNGLLHSQILSLINP